MTTIVTVPGDALDALIVEHYGADALSVALAAVLATNIGLARHGLVLPAVRIELPELPVTQQRIALWT